MHPPILTCLIDFVDRIDFGKLMTCTSRMQKLPALEEVVHSKYVQGLESQMKSYENRLSLAHARELTLRGEVRDMVGPANRYDRARVSCVDCMVTMRMRNEDSHEIITTGQWLCGGCYDTREHFFSNRSLILGTQHIRM